MPISDVVGRRVSIPQFKRARKPNLVTDQRYFLVRALTDFVSFFAYISLNLGKYQIWFNL